MIGTNGNIQVSIPEVDQDYQVPLIEMQNLISGVEVQDGPNSIFPWDS